MGNSIKLVTIFGFMFFLVLLTIAFGTVQSAHIGEMLHSHEWLSTLRWPKLCNQGPWQCRQPLQTDWWLTEPFDTLVVLLKNSLKVKQLKKVTANDKND